MRTMRSVPSRAAVLVPLRCGGGCLAPALLFGVLNGYFPIILHPIFRRPGLPTISISVGLTFVARICRGLGRMIAAWASVGLRHGRGVGREDADHQVSDIRRLVGRRLATGIWRLCTHLIHHVRLHLVDWSLRFLHGSHGLRWLRLRLGPPQIGELDDLVLGAGSLGSLASRCCFSGFFLGGLRFTLLLRPYALSLRFFLNGSTGCMLLFHAALRLLLRLSFGLVLDRFEIQQIV
mmetsp:Transcript_18511/g.40780  ORF Transcript_18511/g.40780 Transcript_18511/m.40780 type:complete len:235 (+) Transcript_18511:150-854(+)